VASFQPVPHRFQWVKPPDSGRNQIEWISGQTVLWVLSNGRRRYAVPVKTWVIEQCSRPGVSLVAVALANRLNTNSVRKWVAQHKGGNGLPGTVDNLPVRVNPAVMLPAPAPMATAMVKASLIDLEIHGARLKLHGAVESERLRAVLDTLAAHR
jgi:transposase